MALFSIRTRLAGSRASPRSKASRASGYRRRRRSASPRTAGWPKDRGSRRSACLKCSTAASQCPRRSSASAAPLRRRGIAGRKPKPLLILLQGTVEVLSDEPFVGAEGQVSLGRPGASATAFSAACRARSASSGVGVLKKYRIELASRPAPTPARSRDPAPRLARRSRAPCAGWPDRWLRCSELLALEKGVVRGEVLRGLLGKPLLFPRSERDAQGLRDLRRDIRLHLEDIRHRRVERLLPLRVGRSGARDLDELGADLHAIAPAALLPADRRRQEVVRRPAPRRSAAASWSSSCRESSCSAR